MKQASTPISIPITLSFANVAKRSYLPIKLAATTAEKIVFSSGRESNHTHSIRLPEVR